MTDKLQTELIPSTEKDGPTIYQNRTNTFPEKDQIKEIIRLRPL